jgi:pimeloyl-ACP methyl ester carboxylesterase
VIWAIRVLVALLALYLLVLLLLWAFQTRILFPATPGGPLPAGAERLMLTAADGVRLEGVHLAPSEPGERSPVLIGFGGNGWSGHRMAEYLRDLFPEAEVIVFNYRGYAPSGGSPGAAAFVADAPLIHDLAAARFPGRPIVAIGFSVGTGVAAGLARDRVLSGLILVTPFDSLSRVASGHYPWAPVRSLFRHDMPVSDWLSRVRTPVALIAADGDTLVPRARTEALRKAVPNLVLDEVIFGAGHNDIYSSETFRRAMDIAMVKVLGPKRARDAGSPRRPLP